jgi:hypothetical protein
VEYWLDVCRITNGAHVETPKLWSKLFGVYFKILVSWSCFSFFKTLVLDTLPPIIFCTSYVICFRMYVLDSVRFASVYPTVHLHMHFLKPLQQTGLCYIRLVSGHLHAVSLLRINSFLFWIFWYRFHRTSSIMPWMRAHENVCHKFPRIELMKILGLFGK